MIKILTVIGQRPTQTPEGTPIPADHCIYNAPRPLYGTLKWEDWNGPWIGSPDGICCY